MVLCARFRGLPAAHPDLAHCTLHVIALVALVARIACIACIACNACNARLLATVQRATRATTTSARRLEAWRRRGRGRCRRRGLGRTVNAGAFLLDDWAGFQDRAAD